MSDESIVDLVKKHQEQGNDVLPDKSESGVESADNERMMRKAAMMSQNMPQDERMGGILEDLLKNVKEKMAWIEIDLPSKGLLYEKNVASIKIRPFTFDDERLLKTMDTMGSNADAVLSQLLDRCIDGLTAAEMTPVDKLYILFRLRGISYGDNYDITHDCVKCTKASQLSLKISTLKITPLDPEYMSFELPDSLQTVEIKLPRSQDEHLYSNNSNLIQNMHMFVRSVASISDRAIIEEFIRKTTVRDIDTIRRKIFLPEYGMEDHFFYSCKDCGTKNRVEIGLNPTFFTAS